MKKKRAAKKSAQTLKKQESENKRIAAEKKGLPEPPSGLAPLRPPDHPPPNPFSDENIKDSAKKANREGRKSIIGLTGEKVDVGKFLKEQNERRKEKGLVVPAGKINLKKYTTKKRTLGNKDSKNPHAVMFGNPLRGKIGSKKKKKAGKRRRTRKKRKRRRTKKKRKRRRKKRRRTRK